MKCVVALAVLAGIALAAPSAKNPKHAGQRTIVNVQPDATTINIDHNNGIADLMIPATTSKVTYLCQSSRRLFLTFESGNAGKVSITVGAKDNVAPAANCVNNDATTPGTDPITVQTEETNTCDRVDSEEAGNVVSTWNVKVAELVDIDGAEALYSSSLTIKCSLALDAAEDAEAPVFDEGNGEASSDQSVEFKLTVAKQDGKPLWDVQFEPKDAGSVGGQLLNIAECSHAPEDGSLPKTVIIEKGCILKGGVSVTRLDGRNSFSMVMRTFRYKGSAAQVKFTCKAYLCDDAACSAACTDPARPVPAPTPAPVIEPEEPTS